MKGYEKTRDMVEVLHTDTAVLPVGSLEQHGSHLPVGTDMLIAEAFAEKVAEDLSAFLLPVIPISTCKEHMGKMGSVWISPITFSHVITDIANSLRVQGYKKLAIIVGHGGIFILPPTIREINATYNPDFFICSTQAYDFEKEYRSQGLLDSECLLHADEVETSLIMHIAPELVQSEHIRDFVPDATRDYLNYGSIFRFSPSGVWGEPSYATPEKGKHILETGARCMVEYIQKAFSFMEGKEKLGYSHF